MNDGEDDAELDEKLTKLGDLANSTIESWVLIEQLEPNDVVFVLAIIHATVLRNTKNADDIDTAIQTYNNTFRAFFTHFQDATPIAQIPIPRRGRKPRKPVS